MISYKGEPLVFNTLSQQAAFFKMFAVTSILSVSAFGMATFGMASLIGWSWIVFVICILVVSASVTIGGEETGILPGKYREYFNKALAPTALICLGLSYESHTVLFWLLLVNLVINYGWSKYVAKFVKPFRAVSKDDPTSVG